VGCLLQTAPARARLLFRATILNYTPGSPLSVVERLDAVTGPFAYVRLLRDREAVDALTPTLDHIVIDRGGEQVADDARAIQVLRQRVPVVAFVNNHYAGYAPETVRQVAELTARE
jgi:uncharacterized protein YecE (DUF72 family)